MATTYIAFLHCRCRIRANQPLCRADFPRDARRARIEGPLANMEGSLKLRAAWFCAARRWVEEERLSLCAVRVSTLALGPGVLRATGALRRRYRAAALSLRKLEQ